VNELRGFINYLYSEIREEEIMKFYLARPTEMTYSQYREEVIRLSTPVDEEKEARLAAAIESKYIVLKPKEVTEANGN